jgi:hypothetical protein
MNRNRGNRLQNCLWIFLFCYLLPAGLAHAQWLPNGSNIYFNGGNVGIGTTAPASILDVYSTKVGGDTLSFKNANTADYMFIGVTNNSNKQLAMIAYGDTQPGTILGNSRGGAAVVLGYNNPTSLLIGTYGDQPVVFGRNNAEAMRIGTNGMVGIGTTNPHQLLQVGNNWSGTSDNSGSSVLVNASGGTQDVIPTMSIAGSASSNTGAYITDIGLDIHNDVAGTTGTRVPALTFSERGATGNYTPTLAGIDAVDLGAGTDVNWRAGGLAFSTANSSGSYGMTEKMRILNNGNVGIGTTNPTQKLEVQDGVSGATMKVSNTAGGYAQLSISGNTNSVATLNFTNKLSINGSYTGYVGIGTTDPQAKLDVAGLIRTSTGILFPDGNTQSMAYTGVTCGGDYAESVDVTGDRTNYAPGDVLVIDADSPGKFLKSATPYSTSVSGIYSTKPGTLGRRQTTAQSPDEVPMAVVGIVPAKVSAENGPIKPGDLLVSSSKIGYAMKGTDRSLLVGAVIGKAMGNLDAGTGVIEVLVTLQ